MFGDLFTQRGLLNMILSIPAILVAFTVHEYAHAKVADMLGDKTPRFQGRLTLNPIAHIDPIGFIFLLIAHFGWAKPVQTNPSAFKNYYKDDLKVSIAGPLANLFTAFIFAFVYYFVVVLLINFGVNDNLINVINGILGSVVAINAMLFILNLLPIPGFDGFHVLRDLFPKKFYAISDAMYRYQMIIFAVLVFTGILGFIVQRPAGIITNSFITIASKVAALFGL